MQRAPIITEDDLSFRDLNRNGTLDPYEDTRLSVEERVEDLLARMTLEEKCGLLFHSIAWVNDQGTLDPPQGFPGPSISQQVSEQMINHFNIFALPKPRVAAQWYNRLQAAAENTRLGIPVTISSDPRHASSKGMAANIASEHYSQWPEPLGLAATGDDELVEQFGDIARQEYLASGIRVALHPMADLATEPRWSRINGTFGEDAQLSARMTAAYIRGFQGPTLGPDSVACMTKHFPGGGPQMNGEDAHFSYGREQAYPGDNFDYHLLPFEAAFEAGTAQIMPYYGMPVGLDLEEVAFGFNKQVITQLLRQKYGFDGVVCTDWGLLNDVKIGDMVMVARAWGVEHLTVSQRAQKVLEAGVDQFGGESCPEIVVALVKEGRIPEARIDHSVRRLLRDKFRLGLFDDPYIDPDTAVEVIGQEAFMAAGALAQRKSIVLLKNRVMAGEAVLPLSGQPKLYIENVDPDAAAGYGQVVNAVDQADLAILRLAAPYDERNEEFLESMFHAGRLDFPQEEKERILGIMAQVPAIVDIYLDRPAVIPEIAEQSAGLLANFGASDGALLDVIFGRFRPSGKLPFEMPSSMEAVENQKEDVPYDSENPLFPFGHGLTY